MVQGERLELPRRFRMPRLQRGVIAARLTLHILVGSARLELARFRTRPST